MMSLGLITITEEFDIFLFLELLVYRVACIFMVFLKCYCIMVHKLAQGTIVV